MEFILQREDDMKKLLFLFLLLSLACRTTALPPTQTTAKAEREPTAIMVADPIEPTPMTVGNVVAVQALHVRADHDLTAESVGYLYSNDLVLEMECFTEDGITWAKHQTGWSVVRNGTAEYIAGVCGG